MLNETLEHASRGSMQLHIGARLNVMTKKILLSYTVYHNYLSMLFSKSVVYYFILCFHHDASHTQYCYAMYQTKA